MEKTKILIIDDDKALCESLRDSIELEGYLTETAYTAEDGIKMVESGFYNIVLLDMKMPDMDGVKALEKIKALSPDTEVIIFTAYAKIENVIEAMERNAFSYLPKPFETSYLVTLIKRAEERQRLVFENYKLFQQVSNGKKEWEDTFNSIPDLISIYDTTFTLTRCNLAFADKFNVKPEELIGKKCEELIGKKCCEIFHCGNDPLQSCPFLKYKKTLKPKREEREIPRIGGIFSFTCFPKFDNSGKLNGIVHIATDITERKKNEELLRTSEERFRAITGAANDAIIMADNDGNILYWNKAAEKILGFAPEEVIERNIAEIIIPDRFREDHIKGYKKLKDPRQAPVIGKTIELAAIRKDGTEIPIELSLSAARIKDKFHAVGIVRDITERKRIEDELKKSNTELKKTLDELNKSHTLLMSQDKLASIGTLAAGVTHEILNPLNIIGTIVQVMQLEKAPDGIKENLNDIMIQVNRAAKITNNLRMFSHHKKAELKSIDIHALFDSIASLQEHDLNLNNIIIDREFDDTEPLIEADEDQLAQVFLNLLNNAKDAMKGRSNNVITISTKAIDEMVEIRFSDNGPGIPREIIGKIFDPFFTTKDPGQGTGLGLSLVYSIIENHGGNIMVNPEKKDGAEFIITLPVKHSSAPVRKT